jgi:hypothetical protein
LFILQVHLLNCRGFFPFSFSKRAASTLGRVARRPVPDAQIVERGTEPPDELHIITNWFDQLRRYAFAAVNTLGVIRNLAAHPAGRSLEPASSGTNIAGRSFGTILRTWLRSHNSRFELLLGC